MKIFSGQEIHANRKIILGQREYQVCRVMTHITKTITEKYHQIISLNIHDENLNTINEYFSLT